MNKPRRPGDQAPPHRTAHRNSHMQTATTHVKDTAGKLYCVHDGSPEQNILRHPDGREMSMLSYEDAKRAKDVAVTRLKARKASIAELDLTGGGEPIDEVALEVAHSLVQTADSFNAPQVDPQLAANQAKAAAAVRPVAAAAQQRADKVQRAPGWEPAPKPSQAATGKAPGWTPPPTGVSAPLGGQKATAVVDPNKVRQTQGSAAGFTDKDGKPVQPSAGQHGAAPTATAGGVKLDDLLDDLNATDEAGGDLSDLIINPDLESDVKAETERRVEVAKKAWESLSQSEQHQVRAQVVRVATEGEREKMYANMDPEQIGTFEALEAAVHLLFGIPPQKAAPAPAPVPEIGSEAELGAEGLVP